MKDKPRNFEHHKCKNCDYYANGRCVWYSRKVDRDNWCKNYTKYYVHFGENKMFE